MESHIHINKVYSNCSSSVYSEDLVCSYQMTRRLIHIFNGLAVIDIYIHIIIITPAPVYVTPANDQSNLWNNAINSTHDQLLSIE